MRQLICNLAIFSSLFALPSAWASGNDQVRNVAEYNLTNVSLALKGYDPVAYFPEGGGVPSLGVENLSLDYKGAIYHFASMDNLQLFAKEPAKYEPTYGGWCAFAMASGQKVDIVPNLFIVNGNRLHLFVAQEALDQFARNVPAFERRADSQWERISGELARK